MINYAITSFRRPECITINALLELGVPKSNITIFLQNQEDYLAYSETWSDINKVLIESSGLNTNRNNALKSYPDGSRIIILDDDVLSFTRLAVINSEKCSSRKITDGAVFNEILESTFCECERVGCFMFGVSPTSNAMFAKSRLLRDGEYSINRLFQGGLIGHVKNDVYYDETYSLMTDYELQLRYYSMGQITLRRNDLSANKKPNGNYFGGLYDTYRIPDKRKNDMERLARQYRDFIEIKPDWSGLKQKV